MPDKLKILFLCTGNSCRSQMAEGWAKALRGEAVEAYSAGIEAHGLNSRAVKVMAEAGVDISGQHSKTADELRDVPFDCVVTVCALAVGVPNMRPTSWIAVNTARPVNSVRTRTAVVFLMSFIVLLRGEVRVDSGRRWSRAPS